jgi:multicomponent Na+:H+ antiporter subunit C
MSFLQAILDNINYIGGVALFLIGLHTVVTHSNLIKRIMGVNIMGSGVFLFFIAIGNVKDGEPPIIRIGEDIVLYINPLPSVLILTGIVVVVSITVYSLALAIRIYQTYGTIDQKEISRIISEESDEY